jgi:hypothetical protein
MYLDYKHLNKMTINDKLCILVINKLLDELQGAIFFTKLGLHYGYDKNRLRQEDNLKKRFRKHEGHCEFW